MNSQMNVCIIFGKDKITVQPREYIEDGWYIESDGDGWMLFEIPPYGGEEHLIERFDNFQDAIIEAWCLT